MIIILQWFYDHFINISFKASNWLSKCRSKADLVVEIPRFHFHFNIVMFYFYTIIVMYFCL